MSVYIMNPWHNLQERTGTSQFMYKTRKLFRLFLIEKSQNNVFVLCFLFYSASDVSI